LRNASLWREMQAEGIGKAIPARVALALIEGKDCNQIVRESVILPEISFPADRFEDSRANLRIRNAEVAASGSDQRPFAQLGLLHAEISGHEHRLLNLAPRASKTLLRCSSPKAGGDRPAGRQLPVEYAFDRCRKIELGMNQSIVRVDGHIGR